MGEPSNFPADLNFQRLEIVELKRGFGKMFCHVNASSLCQIVPGENGSFSVRPQVPFSGAGSSQCEAREGRPEDIPLKLNGPFLTSCPS